MNKLPDEAAPSFVIDAIAYIFWRAYHIVIPGESCD